MSGASLPSVAAGPWIERWLSPGRFAAYLAVAQGDRDRALALYEWNTQLSAAFMHDLAHLEVCLRNAYDSAITATRPSTATHWLDDPAGPVRAPLLRTKRLPNGVRTKIDINRKPRELVAEARRRCGMTAPVGKVIAELQLGFWRYLTSAAHEKTLWVPHLHTAFPPGTNRVIVDQKIGELHMARNRAAHHEPLLALPVAALSADLVWVCALLIPELGQHVQAASQVTALIAARP